MTFDEFKNLCKVHNEEYRSFLVRVCQVPAGELSQKDIQRAEAFRAKEQLLSELHASFKLEIVQAEIAKLSGTTDLIDIFSTPKKETDWS